jgi:starch-binding outer membrane protein, SusD/RagB family
MVPVSALPDHYRLHRDRILTTDRFHEVTYMVTGYRYWRPLAAVALLAGVAGCPSLDIANRNAPERERAFSDPATVKASAAGSIKSYINTRAWYEPSLGPFSTMADEHSFSWNNWQSRYYSSYAAECPLRCGWANETTHPRYEPIPLWWYGMYSVISSANDVLFAIRQSATPPDLGEDAGWVEAIAQLSQGVAHGLVALTYDQGFVVTEESDPTALTLASRTEVRDAALAQLDQAATLAAAADFDVAPNTLFGLPTGPTYSGAQVAQIARTFQAELLAEFARTTTENAATNWAQVVTYASQGISSGTPFDFMVFQSDRLTTEDFFSGIEQWGNDYGTTRIDTRVARLLSTTQLDPWPGGSGNPQPATGAGVPIGGKYGVDRRLGDGCFLAGNTIGDGECAATAVSGTDFLWDPSTYFPASRGQFHQSNIGYIRYHCLVGFFPDCPTGAGDFPVLSQYMNDLLWAEGLARTNTNLGLAADKINRSHVGRGGLPPCTAAGCPGPGVPGGLTAQQSLLAGIYYEWHAELVSMSPDHWFNSRRLAKTNLVSAGPNPWAANQQTYEPEGPYVWNPLWGNSPRSMPIPAKDLALLGLELYSFGGPGDPGGCGTTGPACVMGTDGAPRVKNVRQIYKELMAAQPKPGTRLRQ